MEEKSRFAAGLDVGTNYIRVVVGSIVKDSKGNESLSVVGFNEVTSEGLRRGGVKEIDSPAKAIDDCLLKAESMSGYEINDATVSINGSTIASAKIDGMIAVGTSDHEIEIDDLERVEGIAISGKVPANRQTLEVVPYEYILDGQGGIREPLGMTGNRLELNANVVSVMKPDFDNLLKSCEKASVNARRVTPAVLAAARAVLTNRQRENGVGVVDLGGSTTSVAIYDEGELQFVSVLPIGSNDITRDLATVLMTVPDVAEEIKIRYATGRFENGKDIVIKRGHDDYVFSRKEINEVVEARLEEIFEGVRKVLKHAGYDRRLPEGLVLTGGGAKMRDIDLYARTQVELAVRIGKPERIESVDGSVLRPEYATALGLAMLDMEMGDVAPAIKKGFKFGKKKAKGSGSGLLKSILGKFK